MTHTTHLLFSKCRDAHSKWERQQQPSVTKCTTRKTQRGHKTLADNDCILQFTGKSELRLAAQYLDVEDVYSTVHKHREHSAFGPEHAKIPE